MPRWSDEERDDGRSPRDGAYGVDDPSVPTRVTIDPDLKATNDRLHREYNDLARAYERLRHERRSGAVEAELGQLRTALAEANTFRENVLSQPLTVATVIRVYVKDMLHYVTVAPTGGGGLQDVRLQIKGEYAIGCGDTVWLGLPGSGVVGVAPPIHRCGMTASVKGVLSDHELEVDTYAGSRVVFYAKSKFPGVKDGDRIALDPTGVVATGVVEDTSALGSAYLFTEETHVTWDDVVGLEDQKRELREAIELPYSDPSLFEAYGEPPVRGAILAGPPGCGKSYAAKALASALQQAAKSKRTPSKRGGGTRTGGSLDDRAASGLLLVNGPELIDKYAGQMEAKIRSLFVWARTFEREYGRPAVIVIDEADAILRQRQASEHSYIENKAVPQFLAEMDGLRACKAVVLLLTNVLDALDPAITRHGRMDLVVHFPRPDEAQTCALVMHALASTPVAPDDVDALAAEVTRYVYADDRIVCEYPAPPGWPTPTVHLLLRHCLNAGMVTRGIIGAAKKYARRRDADAGVREPSGVSFVDLVRAVDAVVEQSKNKNHSEELRELFDRGGSS